MENSSPDSARGQRSRLIRLLLLSGAGIGVLFILGRSCGPTDSAAASKEPRRALAPSTPGAVTRKSAKGA